MKTIFEIPNKPYVLSVQENSRNRRFLSTVINDQDNEFDNNKLKKLDSFTVNRAPMVENEVSTKKYNDDDIDKNTNLRFNQILENYLEVSVGIDTYNSAKYGKIQITDKTINKNYSVENNNKRWWN